MNKKLLICYLLFISLAFASCIKKEFTPLKDEGSTFAKILGGDSPFSIKSNFIDFVNTAQKILAIDIRRDCPNNGELEQTNVIVIDDDSSLVAAASASTGVNYVHFPRHWYLLEAEAPKVGGLAYPAGPGPYSASDSAKYQRGGSWTFTFKPGEFAKQIYLVIPNATVLNPSVSYALGFSVRSIDRGGKLSYSKAQVITIGAKNNYDGVYECDFTNYHPTLNSGYTGDVTEVHLVTTGANKCKLYWPLAGTYACPSILGGGFSYFGLQEPEYTINTSTNAVTVQNVAPGAVTFYTMNPSYTSYYDPGIRTIYCKWGYSYVGGTFDPAASREWTQKLKYLGPR